MTAASRRSAGSTCRSRSARSRSRSLMSRPRTLLLDEPSTGLAPLLVAEILRSVQKLQAEGVTIFLVEQNAHAALKIADRAYVMETGRTVLEGTGPELLANDRVRQAYLGFEARCG